MVLTEEEVKALMDQPDTKTTDGLRDRAILHLSDLFLSRQALFIREGKVGKDRLLPLGERAVRRLRRYTHVSIRKFQEIHAATHPAKFENRAALLSSSATAPCVALPSASMQSLAAERGNKKSGCNMYPTGYYNQYAGYEKHHQRIHG